MILQGSLRLEYEGKSYNLTVNTVLKNGTYYFFISDKERKTPLMAGETLELTYTESFCPPYKDQIADSQKIPAEIVMAIEKMLLDNKKLWFY